IVRYLQLFAVPFQLAWESDGQGPERYPLRERRRNAEVGTRRFAPFAGADPVAVVAGRALQEFRREMIISHLLNRDEAGPFAVSAGCDHAFVADKEAAIATVSDTAVNLRFLLCSGIGGFRTRGRWRGLRLGVKESICENASDDLMFRRREAFPGMTGAITRQIPQNLSWRDTLNIGLLHHRIVPKDLDRRHISASRKIKADHGFRRVIVVACPFLTDAFYAGGRAQPQRHVRRSQNVAGHIAQRA